MTVIRHVPGGMVVIDAAELKAPAPPIIRDCFHCPFHTCIYYREMDCAHLHPPPEGTPARVPQQREKTGITISAKDDPKGYARAYYKAKRASLAPKIAAYQKAWRQKKRNAATESP